MNNNFMLQNFIEEGTNHPLPHHPNKKPNKVTSHQLQLLIGTVFNESCQILEDNNIHLDVGVDVHKVTEKVEMFKRIIQGLVGKIGKSEGTDDSNIINCKDCQVYQASLQKLQGEVRQHIRYQQQLKIYQDTQEEKIEQNKKEKKDFEKKIANQKKQLQDLKGLNATITQKTSKLESQIDLLKKQNRQLRRSSSTLQQAPSSKRQSNKQTNPYQSKQNKIDWVHRNINMKRQQKGKDERKSAQKRPESAQRGWRMSNTKSNKMISLMNQKLIQEKTNQERRKIISSKFQYRR